MLWICHGPLTLHAANMTEFGPHDANGPQGPECAATSPPGHGRLYNSGMDESFFAEMTVWLTQVGLAGTSESDIVSGLCNRCVAAGLPLGACAGNGWRGEI
jgi:hypothetical protein